MNLGTWSIAAYNAGGISTYSRFRAKFITHPSRTRLSRATTIRVFMDSTDPNSPGELALHLPLQKTSPDKTKEEAMRISASSSSERMSRKRAERRAYLTAAVITSVGITSMAVASIYYRFAWQMESDDVLFIEMVGTFSLCVGATVGMEYWARWAHRALWHSSLWKMHESHHRPRKGPFEMNDVFAIVNAVPAICLISYGFFHRGLASGLCFGAGLGITLFGIAYMFVHDGLVHRRFPVGPIANVPYFQRVAAAHQIHHANKFQGIPYGLFLGPTELEEIGGSPELEIEAKNWRERSNK